MEGQAPRLVPALVLSAVVALAAALGSLLYVETANVKLSVPPQRLQADTTINAGPNGPDLKTHHVDASVTESQSGSASAVPVPPATASGSVLFYCSPACPTGTRVPQTVATFSGIQFDTRSSGVIPAQGRGLTVPVRAGQAGASGNVAAGSITVIVSPHTPNLRVTNAEATSGGADARTEQAIQQSDFDNVANSLTAKVTSDLTSALIAKTAGMSYVLDGPPIINLTSDYTVGDKTSTFKITIIGTTGATAFSESEARSLLLSALQTKVPAGYQLTSDPLTTSFQILHFSSRGVVAIAGSAVGFIVPVLSTDKLAAEIRGMTVADARRHLQQKVPGSSADISTTPPLVYWLPLISKHISLSVTVEPGTP
jgi:hypothetical protein